MFSSLLIGRSPEHDAAHPDGPLPVLQGGFSRHVNKLLGADQLVFVLQVRRDVKNPESRRRLRPATVTDLHAFHVDPRTHKLLHQQQSLAVPAGDGAADLHVISVHLTWGGSEASGGTFDLGLSLTSYLRFLPQ